MLQSADTSGLQLSAAFRRKEQLDRWAKSATDQQPAHRNDEHSRVTFDRSTVFLAACSQCDLEEVAALISQGVNPNAVNVDGLTALHQACIDDDITMVEFLINHGAEPNVADNEDWTPLHATASCGYMDIASYLIKKGADVSACNSDGDLSIDIAEGTDMENLLAAAMNSQNINADDARKAEEKMMLNDANDWLKDPNQPEHENVKTGATALHVAAAKGYHRVMMALIQADADVNHQDNDGWTPLHGAAHWGQEDSCKILSDALCNMDIIDRAGKTAMDVADESLIKLLKELSEKQKSLRELNKKDSFDKLLIIANKPQMKRRSSVTRMSIEEKEKVAHTSTLEERGTALTTRINEDVELEEVNDVPQKPAEEPSQESTSQVLPSKGQEEETSVEQGGESAATKEEPAAPNEDIKGEEQDVFPEDGRISNDTSATTAPMRSERRAFATIRDEGTTDRSSYPMTAGRSNYIPYYKRQQMEREAKLKEEKDAANEASAAGGSNVEKYSPSLTRSESESDRAPERRSSKYEAPKRDEEAETNRKIKAKRARETRRSTQGVTQDDVKAAEATLKIADNGKNGTTKDTEQTAAPPKQLSINSAASDKPQEEEKSEETGRRRAWQRSLSYDPPSPLSPSSRPTGSPLYSPRAQEEGTRSSFRKARDTIISANSSSSSIPDTLSSSTGYSRYSRPTSENNEERPERQRYSWRNSDRNGVDHKDEDDNKSKEDEENDKNKPRLLRSRRQRRERRSTGVIYYDEHENEKAEDEKEKDTTETPPSNDAQENCCTSTNSGWGSRPFSSRRYGSTSDVPTQMAATGGASTGDRSSYTSRYRRQNPSESELDYKKLFDDLKIENDKLKSQVKGLLSEVAETKQAASKSRGSTNSDSLADKRERRALERKVSELEEELKKMEALRHDNVRLKEENGALIRVISKLSK